MLIIYILEALYNECREKYQAENMAFDPSSIAQHSGGIISYNFSQEIANNFRSYNNDSITHFGHLIQSFSSLFSILEQVASSSTSKEVKVKHARLNPYTI